MSRSARRLFPRLVRTCWSQGHHIVAATVLVALFTLLYPPTAAATNVSGTISTNTTWTLANSPYVMTGNVTVASGVTLTIEAGVVVQGNSNLRSLTINGSVSAVGNVDHPITFTSTSDSAPAQWLGITFPSGSSGTSSLKFVNVRYGGGGAGNDLTGEVAINGGTVTVEDSNISSSSVSGLAMNGGTNGTAATLTVRRTKFENNGVYANSSGDGLYSNNGRFVIEDSAFWSNKSDGLVAGVTSAFTPSPSAISGSSFWKNGRYGVYIDQGSGAATLGPDGNISGKLGNVIYDNGTFGFSSTETWQQLKLTRDGAPAVDWSNAYWGPVDEIVCGMGSQNGHLSFEFPDANTTTPYPIDRGPVSYTTATDLTDPNNPLWCGNDSALDYPVADEMPAIYFPPPVPPVMGGVQLEQTYSSLRCPHCSDKQFANSAGNYDRGPFGHSPEPVNTASGTLTEDATDLRLSGPGIPFAWTRTYNSRDTTSGALGPGWSHPYWATVTIANPPTGDLLDYRAGSGQRTRFKRITGGTSGAATFIARGFDGTLKRLSDNTYVLTTRDQRTFTFNTAGNLTQMKPRFGPATTLAYTSGKLTSITDSAGRTITITYTVADPTLIEKVTLPDGRYVQYSYTSGRLTSVRDPRRKTWTLAYDGNGRLTSIQDPVGHYELQNILYDSNGRVTSEQNGTGDTIGYAYTTSGGYDVTTVTIPGRGDWVYKHAGYLLFQVKNPLNKTTYFTYDGGARKATVKDARGYLRRFTYDRRGNPLKDIAPQNLGTVVRTFNSTNDPLTVKDGRLNTTTYAYASASDAAADYQVGQLKTITDRENGTTTFKYWTTSSTPTPPATNVGLVKRVTNQRSKTTSYDYDSSGNLTKITSPLGLKTTMTYDSSGRLTSRRDPRGNVPVPPAGYLTQWAYDDADHVTTLTDARGNATSFDYYDNERLWKTTVNDGTARVTTFEYDNANRLWKTTDPRSGIETRLYWADGQLKSLQSPEGRKTTYDYDTAGQLVTLVEPNGNATGGTPSDWTWTYGYDDAGNRTSEAHPDGGSRQIAYDALNRPYQWTDALNHVTSVEYDANSNVTKRTDGLTHFRTYTYDKLDRLATMVDERSKTWSYGYWETGEPKSVTTPLGNKTTYALDDDGRAASMVEPRGNVTGADPDQYKWLYQYDEAGNRTRVTNPLGNYIQYGYDAVNDLTQVTDQRGNATAFTYDALNRLSTVTPPAAGGSGTLDTVYGYDAASNLISRTDPNGHATSWTYDLDHLLTQRVTPVGTWNRTYDTNGNLKTLETPAGSSTPTAGDGTITFGYDRMSRQTSVDYSDTTPDVSRTWDDAGRPATMSDGSGTVTYSFDAADRLTDIARTGGGSGLNGTFHYDYDDTGNITGRTYPDTTTTSSQTFDDDGRLLTVASAGQTTTLGYDAAGNLTTETLPSGNGHVATRTFDRAGRLTTVENAKTGTILSKFLWTLDAAGNPTKAQTTRGAGDTYDAYEYDSRNRLTASCFGVTAGATDCTGAANTISYAYDKVTNRTQEVRTGSVGNTGTIDYAYNSADQLTSTTQGGTTTNYSYDTNGNQASIGARTFSYDLADQLVSTTNAGTTSTYGYDGDGRRISSTTGGGGADLRYIWDPLAESGIPELALERTPAGALVRRYLDDSLGPIALTNSSATFYYHRDPLDSVTDVTDANGTAQWKYEYEAYGAERTATNVSGTAPENRLRFNNQYLDSETGLYHLRARQYDPATGRFDALDPVENSLSEPFTDPYVYVNGQPTVLVDPLGLGAWDRFKGVAGAGAHAVGGSAAALKDTAVAILPYSNPITYQYGLAKRGYDAYRTYKAYGGGWIGVLEASQHFNPAYPFAFNLEQCLQSNSASGRGYDCTKAFVDGLLFVVGARACASIPGEVAAADEGAASLGSTGRTVAAGLKEQLAMKQAMSDPAAGTRLPITMSDPRWPASDGWVKMSQNINGVEIHYVRNTVTGAVDDFKFK